MAHDVGTMPTDGAPWHKDIDDQKIDVATVRSVLANHTPWVRAYSDECCGDTQVWECDALGCDWKSSSSYDFNQHLEKVILG